MFKKRSSAAPFLTPAQPGPEERVTSVIGTGIAWKGNFSGSGEVRIEGAFEGEIDLRGFQHLPIREVVMKLQETELEQQDRVFGSAPLIRAVTFRDQTSHRREVHHRFDLPQVMISRHKLGKDELIEFGRGGVISFFEHRGLLSHGTSYAPSGRMPSF